MDTGGGWERVPTPTETFKPALWLLRVRRLGREANHASVSKSVLCCFCKLTVPAIHTRQKKSLHIAGNPLVACNLMCDHVAIHVTSTIIFVTSPGNPVVSCNLMCDHVAIHGTSTVIFVTSPGKPLVACNFMCNHVVIQGTSTILFITKLQGIPWCVITWSYKVLVQSYSLQNSRESPSCV
jgi:hypothetical protein